MQKFKVTGMSCAACSARVEKAVSAVENSAPVSVNLLTGDLTVGDGADENAVKAAVINAGYGIDEGTATESENTELDSLKRRLISSVIILLVLMYFSMFHSMFGATLPAALAGNHVVLGIIQFVLTLAVCIINRRFFINGAKGVKNRAPNMDTLVAMGAAAAFLYSLYIVIRMIIGGYTGSHHLYFESAAMILTLVTVGKTLEAKAKGRSTDAIKSLKEIAPKTAVKLVDGKEVKVAADELKPGDLFLVRPGESIPADGVCTEGFAAVDESAVTGESIPAEKSAGSKVMSGSTALNGTIICRAEAVGADSTFSKIIKTVTEATATKAPIARLADKVAGIFVPTVMAIALVTLIVWLIAGRGTGFALARAISVLVISCPCALGLATPVAIMVASGVGAKYGVLYKSAESLETCGRIKTVLLDKTGTVTQGSPRVTDIFSTDEKQFLSIAYGLERQSSHPLSAAVCEYAAAAGVAPAKVERFTEIAGKGITGETGGERIFGGNLAAAAEYCTVDGDTAAFVEKISLEGKTPLVFVKGGSVLGIIAAADTVKADSAKAVKMLNDMGIDTVMLTGDNEKTARAIAKTAGIKQVFAGVLPDGKAEKVKEYANKAKAAMVGDGINDAPALTAADVGIAIGGGRDIASKASDVVLMKNSLMGAVAALKLGRKALLNIKENLFWAFIYNIIGIPIAAGVFIPVFGLELDPMFGAAAMSLSSFCVVMNALRIRFFKIDKKTDTEVDNMKKVLKVTGMSCEHCEARVEAALGKLPGVEKAKANHKKCEAVVKLSAEVDNETLKAAVESEGYKVEGIE